MPAVLLAALCLPATVQVQAPQPEPLAISSPAEGSYITGPVLLQARAKAPDTVRTVTFFADGRSVCTVARPPFECNWDAGTGLREHVVRAVATLADGGKLVATSRTRSAGYIEAVEVEVVQVTATVTDDEGRFVKGLARDQFRVKEDGVPQRLTAFAGENIPLEIVVAVDVSHSMTDSMPTLKAAVRDLPYRPAAIRSGDLAGVQRQHLHAGPPGHRAGLALARRRPAGPLGRHGAV